MPIVRGLNDVHLIIESLEKNPADNGRARWLSSELTAKAKPHQITDTLQATRSQRN